MIKIELLSMTSKQLTCPFHFNCTVKRIRSTVDEKEQKQLLMDLEVVMKSNDCKYIVQFYGALFKEVRIDRNCAFRILLKMCRVNF